MSCYSTWEQVFEKIKAICVEQLGVEEDEVTPDASFTDNLHADSLDAVEMIMSLEEKFSENGHTVEIPDKEAEAITTPGEAADLVCAKLGIPGRQPANA